MDIRQSIPTVGAALVAALLAACDVKVGEKGLSLDIAHGRATDEWSRTYSLPTGGQLEIANANGSIEATGVDGTELRVTATRSVRGMSDEASAQALRDLHMEEDTAGERVRIEATPKERGAWRNTRVDYAIEAPRGMSLSLKTDNGQIRLQQLEGRISVAVTNGGINLADVTGPVTASTVNGGVQVQLSSLSGEVELTTVNGGVRLELPMGVAATMDAAAVNGGVSVDDELPLQATERGRNRVAGTLNGGGPKIALRTTNGGIRVGTGSRSRSD